MRGVDYRSMIHVMHFSKSRKCSKHVNRKREGADLWISSISWQNLHRRLVLTLASVVQVHENVVWKTQTMESIFIWPTRQRGLRIAEHQFYNPYSDTGILAFRRTSCREHLAETTMFYTCSVPCEAAKFCLSLRGAYYASRLL